jgi:hypothetical protein
VNEASERGAVGRRSVEAARARTSARLSGAFSSFLCRPASSSAPILKREPRRKFPATVYTSLTPFSASFRNNADDRQSAGAPKTARSLAPRGERRCRRSRGRNRPWPCSARHRMGRAARRSILVRFSPPSARRSTTGTSRDRARSRARRGDAAGRAEEALSSAKRALGRSFVLYDAAKARDTGRRSAGSPSHEMIEALNSRRIAFAAQPIVEAQSRAVAFREALMRIRTDDRLVSAGAILPAFERAGLMPLVDARMLELVADHLAGHGEWASITCRGGIAARRCWPATKASRRRGTRPEDAISVTAPRASPACRPSDA